MIYVDNWQLLTIEKFIKTNTISVLTLPSTSFCIDFTMGPELSWSQWHITEYTHVQLALETIKKLKTFHWQWVWYCFSSSKHTEIQSWVQVEWTNYKYTVIKWNLLRFDLTRKILRGMIKIVWHQLCENVLFKPNYDFGWVG